MSRAITSHRPNTVHRHTPHNDFEVRLGERIFLLREERGLSQERLANLVGIDKTTLGFMERGCVRWTVQRLIAVCTGLSLDPCKLVCYMKEAQ